MNPIFQTTSEAVEDLAREFGLGDHPEQEEDQTDGE